MFEAFSDDAESQRLDFCNSLIAVCAVTHDTRQRRHFRQPSAVVLALELDRKSHSRTVASAHAEG